ncbi:hypothetical protein GCM10027082_04840 [Comamonas humi]
MFRRQALGVLLVLAGLCGAAQAASGPGERSISISRQQLQQAVSSRFPLARSWQGLVVLQLDRAQVQLQPEANRLQTVVDLSVTEKLLGTRYPGRMQLDFGLRFDEAGASIRMHPVTVQQLHLDGVPSEYQALFQAQAPRLAEQVLDNLVLYQLPESQKMLLDGLGYGVRRFEVLPDGLRVVLGPKG